MPKALVFAAFEPSNEFGRKLVGVIPLTKNVLAAIKECVVFEQIVQQVRIASIVFHFSRADITMYDAEGIDVESDIIQSRCNGDLDYETKILDEPPSILEQDRVYLNSVYLDISKYQILVRAYDLGGSLIEAMSAFCPSLVLGQSFKRQERS